MTTHALRTNPQNARRFRRVRGFSLVELLTAMAITSILMLALFSIVGQSSTNYRISQRKVTTLADSRALFHFLENEIASRLTNTKFFLQTSSANQSEFAFIRTRDAQDSNATGDLSATIYYVAFTADDNNSGSPKLYRRTLDGTATQKLIEAGDAATFPTYDPSTDDPIAYNILRFDAKAQQRNALGEWEPWSQTAGTAPEMIELTLEIIDDFSSQRIPQQAQWTALAESTDSKKREAVRRYVHRLYLNP